MVELVGSRESTTRGTALNALASVYKLLGDDIWKFTGKEITDGKIKDLIADKFRFTEKQMEKSGEWATVCIVRATVWISRATVWILRAT
eukprot:2235153-Pyramimonas_sp.AAC.1